MRYKMTENREIGEGMFRMKILAPDISAAACPGQFVSLLIPNDRSKILRRPISICDVEGDALVIVYQVRGEGTMLLSQQEAGGHIDLLGPLGKGFPLSGSRKAALIGGGIGIFPLLYLKKALSAISETDCYLGFRNSGCVVFEDEFRSGGSSVCISTDDGSMYNTGLIPAFFEKNAHKYDIAYSCGPAAMMKEVKRICEERDLQLYLSLEQRMGCGIGACLVCACKVKSGNEQGFEYKRVCRDGPVFDSREVIL